MDDERFDRLTRSLSAAGSRRSLFGFLAALPLHGGLTALVDASDVGDTGGRRKQHKKRHKHGRGRHKGKHKKQKCQPESRAKTCAGQCGFVKNNCRTPANCGPCLCEPACPACQVCDDVTGACVPDPAQEGDSCGPGQLCQTDGTCRCGATSCGVCETCQEDGVCSALCDGESCCAGDHCEFGNTIEACGIDGETCQICAENEVCWNGRCVCGDVCAEGCQFDTIQAAIDAAEPGATIRLCAETYRTQIHITKDLTLRGVGDAADGSVIDGRGIGPVVRTSLDKSVTLQGLRITGGAQSITGEEGGGIYLNRGTHILIDCTVTGNTGERWGGGIYNRGGYLTLRNTHVTENVAGINGGGINTEFETLTLEDSVVSGNMAGRNGGGIFAWGTVKLINTEVTGNVAELEEGGGIVIAGILRLTNSQVTDNTAATLGGGIAVAGILHLTNSQIADNAAEEGGGIYNDRSTVTLTESSIEDNTPDNCAGDPVAGCSG